MALTEVKTLLGIPSGDSSKDAVLNILLNQANSFICAYLKVNTVPANASWIADRIAIALYNRIGAEGVKIEAVESVQYTYNDVFQEHKPLLDIYARTDSAASSPRMVRML